MHRIQCTTDDSGSCSTSTGIENGRFLEPKNSNLAGVVISITHKHQICWEYTFGGKKSGLFVPNNLIRFLLIHFIHTRAMYITRKRTSPSPQRGRSQSPSGTRGGFCTLLCYMMFFGLSALLVVTVDFTEMASIDKVPKKKGNVKQITVLGERNSGTRWTFRYVF